MAKKRQVTITMDHVISTLVYIRNLTDAMIAALMAGTGTAAHALPGPLYLDRAYAKDCLPPEGDKAWAKDCPPPQVMKAWAKDCPPPRATKAWAKDCPPPQATKAWAKDCLPPATVTAPRGKVCPVVHLGDPVMILPPPKVRQAKK